jgi:hypothetical protein
VTWEPIRRPRAALALACAAACCLTAIAAASAQEGPDRAKINVFISPAGEPFRAAPGQPYPVEAWFNQADANHDGVVTQDEFVADAVAFFHKLDTNHDGVIDGFEISNYEQHVAPEILPRVGGLTARDIPPLPSRDPEEQRQRQLQAAQDQQQELARAHRSGPVYDGAAVFGLIREPEPVAAADLDFDGKITLQEWIAAARRHFAELDVSGDGRLTLAELPKTPAEKLGDKGKHKPKGEHHEPPSHRE